MNTQSRLAWRCRRGIKEMDILLERFLAEDYPLLNSKQQQTFENFLEETDLDIMSWLMNRSEPANSDYVEIVRRLQQINIINTHD